MKVLDTIRPNKVVPEGEVWIVENGKVIGRIVNVIMYDHPRIVNVERGDRWVVPALIILSVAFWTALVSLVLWAM